MLLPGYYFYYVEILPGELPRSEDLVYGIWKENGIPRDWQGLVRREKHLKCSFKYVKM